MGLFKATASNAEAARKVQIPFLMRGGNSHQPVTKGRHGGTLSKPVLKREIRCLQAMDTPDLLVESTNCRSATTDKPARGKVLQKHSVDVSGIVKCDNDACLEDNETGRALIEPTHF